MSGRHLEVAKYMILAGSHGFLLTLYHSVELVLPENMFCNFIVAINCLRGWNNA